MTTLLTAITVRLALGMLLLAPVTALAQQPAEWTLMVFLNGDNNLESFAVDDFMEMSQVGSLDATDGTKRPIVNVVTQFDRIRPAGGGRDRTDKRYGNWGGTLRFRVTKGMEPTPANAVQDLGEVDMGKGENLSQFVSWARTNYPARRYMLVLWDHGQGWRLSNLLRLRDRHTLRPSASSRDGEPDSAPLRLADTATVLDLQRGAFEYVPSDLNVTDVFRSISTDDTDGSVLFNREIQDELQTLLGANRLDVIGFDACLMSMVETAFSMRRVAAVMVGSEELEPGQGWNYELLLRGIAADPTMDAAGLGRAVVKAFRDHYSTFSNETTLSAVSLDEAEGVATGVSELADALRQSIATGNANRLVHAKELRTARAECEIYAPQYGIYHHIDLGRFLDQLVGGSSDQGVRTAVQQLRARIGTAVLANFASRSRDVSTRWGSSGLAIYFPETKELFEEDVNRLAYSEANTHYPVEFVQRHRWDNFLAEWLR
jgi:hypothetical protein